MDAASAQAIREYVSGGGTVLMTAFSAKVDGHGQWFATPLPGQLTDVFGLKTNAFYDAAALSFQLGEQTIETRLHRYEVLEPSTATVVARFTNTVGRTPAITINKFGKGKAIYLATESNASAIGPVLHYLETVSGIEPGPKTPEGVYARVVDGRTLFVNTTSEMKKVTIEGRKRGIVTNRVYDGAVILGPLEADVVQ